MLLLILMLVVLSQRVNEQLDEPLPNSLRRQLLQRAESISNIRIVSRVSVRSESSSEVTTDAFEETVFWVRDQGTVCVRRTLFPVNVPEESTSTFYYMDGSRTQMIGPLLPDANRFIAEVIDAPEDTDIGARLIPGLLDTGTIVRRNWRLVHDDGTTLELSVRGEGGHTSCTLSHVYGGMLLTRRITKMQQGHEEHLVARFADPVSVDGLWVPQWITTRITFGAGQEQGAKTRTESRIVLDCDVNDPAPSLPEPPFLGRGSIVANHRSLFGGGAAVLGFVVQSEDPVSIEEATIDRLLKRASSKSEGVSRRIGSIHWELPGLALAAAGILVILTLVVRRFLTRWKQMRREG